MKKNMTPLLLALSLSFIASCGKDSGSGRERDSGIQEQEAEGSYRAIIRPINNSLSGFIPSGIAEIKIDGDNVEVRTLINDDAPVTHIQSIHAGTRCPNLASDNNRDSIIDVNEAMRVTGQVLIPLNGDLNSADAGEDGYPVGRNYTYLKTASLDKLEEDVRSRMNQNLNLGGRVVMVHGVAGNTEMPTTVSALEGSTPQASVPIACGILQRIE